MNASWKVDLGLHQQSAAVGVGKLKERMNVDTDRYDPFEDEPSALKRGWNWFNMLLDFIMWFWNQLVLYVCFFFLAPMLIAVALNLVVDVRPWVRANKDLLVGLLFAGVPLWLMICGYAAIGKSNFAKRIKAYQSTGLLVVGAVLLIGGGIAWLLGWLK